jgi:hypothetical protein
MDTMESLSVMPHALEVQYRTSETAKAHACTWDTMGCLIGILINVLPFLISRVEHQSTSMLVVGAASATLQAAQLVWLRARPASYWTLRDRITLFQRIRWFIMNYLQQKLSPPEKMIWHRAGQDSRSLRAFLAVALYFPMLPMFNTLIHMGSFKQQIMLAPLLVLHHVLFGLKNQLFLFDHHDLRHFVPRVCQYIHLIASPSPIGVDHPYYCMEGHAAFLLTFIYTMVAVIIPLYLTCWVQYRSKLFFFKSIRPASGDVGILRPFGCFAMMHFWACSTLCWSFLALLYPAFAPSPVDAYAP